MFSKHLRYTAVEISLDADGCVFNNNYNQASNMANINDAEVVNANQPLSQYLYNLQDRHPGARFEMISGSLRQCHGNDELNSNGCKTRSFFLELEVYHQHLKNKIKDLTLCKYLSADVESGYPVGYSFDKSRGRIKDSLPHRDSIDDLSKICLLYLQMHRFAANNPEGDLVFYFFDDKPEILNALEFFYNKYPELVPANLTLNITPYTGSLGVPRKPIHGKGPIDFEYEEGFLDMVSCATRRKRGQILCLAGDAMLMKFDSKKFKALRGLDYSSVDEEKQTEVYPAFFERMNFSAVQPSQANRTKDKEIELEEIDGFKSVRFDL